MIPLAYQAGAVAHQRSINDSGSPSWTPQTKAFLEASGIVNDATVYFASTAYAQTGHDIWLAINKFTKGLIEDGVWDKLIALYPLIGENYNQAKFNLINPLDSDAAHRLEEGGVLSYNGMGVTFNGINNYLRTNIIPSAQGAYNDFSVGAYLLSLPEAGLKAIFSAQGATAAERFTVYPDYGDGLLVALPGADNTLGITPSPTDGLGLTQFYSEEGLLRCAIDDIDRNAGLTLVNTGIMPLVDIYLGCANLNGIPDRFNAYTLSSFYYGYAMTSVDSSNLAKRLNQLMIDMKRVTYTAISKTITFDNTGNEALNNYMAEIDLTATEFSFDKILSGENMNFVDAGANLPYYVAKYNKIDSTIKAFVKVNIPANTVKAITLNTGVNSISRYKYNQLMLRKSAISITKELYNMASISDSKVVGAGMTLVNSFLIDSQFGKVLSCNGINAYATIVRDFPSLDTYDMCTISFNFCLKKDQKYYGVSQTIFSKYVDATHYVKVSIETDNRIYIITSSGIYATPIGVGFKKFEPHSISIRINKVYIDMKIDNVIGFKVLTTALTGGQPFTLGAYNNGSVSAFANVYIWDLEFTEGYNMIGVEFARNKGIPVQHDVEYKKWEYVSDVPSFVGDPDGVLRQEPSIITVGTELHLYSTDRDVAAPGISRRVSTTNGATWSSPVGVSITGLVGNSQRPFIFQDSGKIYMIYQRDGKLYISESTDGLSFTNPQIWQEVQVGFTSIENSCVYRDPDTGVYYGIVDGMNTAASDWRMVALSGDSIMTMTKMYDVTSITPTIIDGGAFFKKLNGIYQVWVQSNLEIYRFKNTDITTDTWTRVYPNTPVFVLNGKCGQEQQADTSLCEKSGVCYAAVNNSGDASGTTGNNSILKYNGTLEQLVSDLSIAIT